MAKNVLDCHITVPLGEFISSFSDNFLDSPKSISLTVEGSSVIFNRKFSGFRSR
jgi:hypothetical protein